MAINNTNFIPAMTTDEIGVSNSGIPLTTYLEDMESEVASKAPGSLVGVVDALDTAVSELAEAIENIQVGGGGTSGTVEPMLVASMHLGKLDNNSGAENSSSTRICSDPIPVTPGGSYWQVNDKAVNMYVLIYDADELFLGYLGSFASGAEIAITNANAAYMRLGSLLGEYDLTNEFRIYDTDPAGVGSSGGGAAVDAYTKTEADARFAPIAHTHNGYATVEQFDEITSDVAQMSSDVANFHSELMLVYDDINGKAPASHTHTAAEITGLPSSVDAYSRTEADNRFAPASHNHSGYAAEGHTHSGYAAATHSHTEYAASGHTHTPASIGAAAASHTHDYAASNHTHSGYAASSHTHSGYASSSHDHDDDYAAKSHTHHPANIGALSSSGGTIDGALTVMLSSIFNGVLNTQKIMPKDAGSYSIGDADNRYYSTYLKVSPNVSSDRRCKRDIVDLDVNTLAEFVRKLPVVSYKYNDDAAGEAKKIGMVAQDVIAADPEISRFFVEQDAKGFFSLRPADLVFPLIAAVQVLSVKVAELEGNK